MKLKNGIMNFVKGVFVGVANIIPGVSGGTIAVILGIFDELIAAVNRIRTQLKKSLSLLIPIGLGAGVGILLFSKLIKYSLEHFPAPTNLFFTGLILGSIPFIYKKATSKDFRWGYAVSLVLAMGIVVLFAVMKPPESGQIIRELTVGSFFSILFSGLIAAAAMVIPGVSGSFVMILLGMYETVLTAIDEMNVLILIPLAIGVLLGLILIVKLIAFVMDKFFGYTYYAILGFILGSLFGMFYNKELYETISFPIIASCIVTLTAGFFLAMAFSSDKKQ